MMSEVMKDKGAAALTAEAVSPSHCMALLHEVASASLWKYTVVDQIIVGKKLVWIFENVPGSIDHINDVGANGMTALQTAVSHSNWTLVLELLRAGAGMDLMNGNSILHVLVCDTISLKMQLPVLESLMERGADLDEADPQGHTAVHLAAWCHKWDLVKVLLEHGASPTPKDSTKLTLFHRLATLSSQSPVFSKQKHMLEEVATMLLTAGVDLNELAEWSGAMVSALHIAVEKENWLTVEIFLLLGADPITVCIQGQGVLHRIAKSLNFKGKGMMSLLMRLILLLENKGLDINALDCNGNSSLSLALGPGSFKPTTWFLLACGAKLQLEKLNDVLIRDFIGSLSLMPKNMLSGEELKDVVQQLSGAYSASPESMKYIMQAAFRDALKLENYCIAWVLVDCGANLNDQRCGHLISQSIFKAGRMNSFTQDYETFLDCMLSHNTSLPFEIKCPLHFMLKVTQQRLKRFAREGTPDISDVTSVLRKLIARGADPLEVVHSRSVLRAALEMCCSRSESHLLLLPILRVLIEAGVSTHQPALTLKESHQNFQPLSNLSQAIPTVQYHCGGGGAHQNISCHHYLVNPMKAWSALKSPNILYWTSDPKVVDIFIQSGACSRKELFQWMEFLGTLVPSAEVSALLKVAEAHAGTVPPLTSLARLSVSHAIGCGARRKRFFEMESVPGKLKHYVQFVDLFVEKVTHL